MTAPSDVAVVSPRIPSNSPDASTAAAKALNALGELEVHSGTGGAGVIGIVAGTVLITDSGAALLTLAAPAAGAPSAGGNDGNRLTIVSTTAIAHTVTTPANGINGADSIATFSAVADRIELIAMDGVWYAINNSTTLS